MIQLKRILSTAAVLSLMSLSVACPPGEVCSWTVNNETGFTLVGVEISDTDDTLWGGDLLAGDLLTGESEVFLVDAGATYDLRATDVDGDTYTYPAAGTCTNADALSTTVRLADID